MRQAVGAAVLVLALGSWALGSAMRSSDRAIVTEAGSASERTGTGTKGLVPDALLARNPGPRLQFPVVRPMMMDAGGSDGLAIKST